MGLPEFWKLPSRFGDALDGTMLLPEEVAWWADTGGLEPDCLSDKATCNWLRQPLGTQTCSQRHSSIIIRIIHICILYVEMHVYIYVYICNYMCVYIYVHMCIQYTGMCICVYNVYIRLYLTFQSSEDLDDTLFPTKARGK